MELPNVPVTLSRIHWRFSENAVDMCNTSVNANHGEKNAPGMDNLLNKLGTKHNQFVSNCERWGTK